MRNLVDSHPAISYLNMVLQTRIASARAAAEGEDRQLGASAVEWVVITLIVLVIAGGAAAIIIPAISRKTTSIQTCIDNSGTQTACAP